MVACGANLPWCCSAADDSATILIRGRGEERVFFARKCERPRQCCARVVVLEHERAYSLSGAFLGFGTVDVFGIMVEIAASTAVDGLARSRGVDCQV